MDRVATMIWRNQNNGPEEAGGDSQEEPRSDAADAGGSSDAMTSIGERVETVLEAAERAAADIRRDAEQWAQQHMEETRRRADELAAQRVQELSSITDDLLSRAQAVARQSDDLISALDSASRRALKVPLRRQSDREPEPAAQEPASNGSQGEAGPAAAVPASDDRDPRPAGPVSDGARLLATQMAVAGSSRERIAARLREEFGIEDPSAILDEAGL